MISLERREGRPLRIGHRGAPGLAPENTLRSFRAARDAGVDLIELDLLRLDGGQVVVAHSNDLHEVSHGLHASGTVQDKTLAELRELCPELPTLDEALTFFVDEAPGVGVHADVKSAGAVGAVAAALRERGLGERGLVTSTNVRALRKLAQREPGVRGALTFPRAILGVTEDGRGAPLARAALGSARAAMRVLPPVLLSVSRTTALSLHHTVVTEAGVRSAHDRGAAVIAWTVDDPDELARVEAAGVDAVVSNDPAIFGSTLSV